MLSPRKKVLVVDADEIVLALLTHILTRQGYLVDPAVNAQQAASLLREGSYAALLIDWKLAGSDTWLRNALANRPSLAKRLVITGSPGDTDLPVRTVLPKPIEFDVLIRVVEDCSKASD